MAEHAGRDWVFSLFDIVILGRDARAAVLRVDGAFGFELDVFGVCYFGTVLRAQSLAGVRMPVRDFSFGWGLGRVDPCRWTAIA